MIRITASDGKIVVEGHAGYAPRGQDIVCSAISTLTQTFLASLTQLSTTGEKHALTSDIKAGYAVIGYKDLDEAGMLLKESFLLGVRGVAEAYPGHVKLTEH